MSISVLLVAAAGAAGAWLHRSPGAGAKAAGVPAGPAQPIRIGIPVGLSGANGLVAPTVVQSSKMAADEINEAGGILGRKVVLDIVDDGSDAAGATKALAALTQERRVDAVIAMETSSARSAALEVVSRTKTPYIYTSFYEGHACNPWMYVNGWVPEQQVTPIVSFLVHKKSARRFFLVGSDYSFGRGMLQFAKEQIVQAGAQVVAEEYLPVDASDWTAVIDKIRAAKPDALISATAGGAPNVSLARQLRAAGLKLSYGNLAIDESTAKQMGESATGMLMAASYLTSIESKENAVFLGRMLVKFGADLQAPNELSVPQYEALHLYKAAVEKAGTTEPASVIRALGEVTYTGPRGEVRMASGRHTALAMRLGRVRSDGSIAVIDTFPAVPPGSQCPADTASTGSPDRGGHAAGDAVAAEREKS